MAHKNITVKKTLSKWRLDIAQQVLRYLWNEADKKMLMTLAVGFLGARIDGSLI